MSINMNGHAADVSEEFLEWVASSICEKQNDGLQVKCSNIDFSSCKLNDEQLSRIIDVLEMYEVPCQRLKLYNNQIADIEPILRYLDCASGQQIREIHLSHNQLNDEQCNVLVQKCKELGPNPLPIWLRIEHNPVANPQKALQGIMDAQVVFASGLREVAKTVSVAVHRSFINPKMVAQSAAPRVVPMNTLIKPAIVKGGAKGSGKGTKQVKLVHNKSFTTAPVMQPLQPQRAIGAHIKPAQGRTSCLLRPAVAQQAPRPALVLRAAPPQIQHQARMQIPLGRQTPTRVIKPPTGLGLPVPVAAMQTMATRPITVSRKIPVPPTKKLTETIKPTGKITFSTSVPNLTKKFPCPPAQGKIPVPPAGNKGKIGQLPPTSKAAGLRLQRS